MPVCIQSMIGSIITSENRLHKLSTKRSEYLYRRYVAYVVGTAILFLVMINLRHEALCSVICF